MKKLFLALICLVFAFAFASCDLIKRAFFLCTNLSEIVIGQNVTSIGSNAFGWCTYLYVYYEGTADDWDKISIAGYNDELDDIYFYSESPTYSNDCWHYDENGNIAFW